MHFLQVPCGEKRLLSCLEKNRNGAARHSKLAFLVEKSNCGRAKAKRLDCPAARNQVDHRYNERNYEQQMDQTASNMKSPAKKPEDNEDRENCPKHRFPLIIKRRTSTAIECEAAS